MSDFIIPSNKDFEFTLKVMENDSFLPQDLTDMSTATMVLFDKATTTATTVAISLSVVDAVNGIIKGSIAAAETDKLDISRGPKEDDYYLKSLYQGSIGITFTDGTLPINVLVEDVYVAPTGY